MVKLETVRQLALALPGTTEKLSYGSPAFFVSGKVFCGIRGDTNTIFVKSTEIDRRALAALEPHIYTITPHFENYPGMIVNLATIDRRSLQAIIIAAWRYAAPKKLCAAYDGLHHDDAAQPIKKSSTEKK